MRCPSAVGHGTLPHQGAATQPDAQAGLEGIEIALERYTLGVDPGVAVRPWPQIAADLQRLVTTMLWTADYAGQAKMAPVLLRELHGAYVRLPHQRPEILVGLMRAYSSMMWTTKRLGDRGLPSLAARGAQQCAEVLADPLWLGYAARLHGCATGHLDRVRHYQRSVAAAQTLTGMLDCNDALQACGTLHLSAAQAAGAQADHDTAATHLAEAATLAARMDTEVGTWAGLQCTTSTHPQTQTPGATQGVVDKEDDGREGQHGRRDSVRTRLRELRCWRRLTLREAAGLAQSGVPRPPDPRCAQH